MFEQMVGTVPEQWREIAQLLMAPIIWIPRLERQLIDLIFNSSSGWTAAGKYLFLLFPVLLGIAAIWCTQLSIYTLPFRSRRIAFVSAMLMTWWEGARAVWLYWVGVFRMAAVVAGWVFSLARLAVKLVLEALHQLVLMPFTMTGRMTNQYFQPGVPWIAQQTGDKFRPGIGFTLSLATFGWVGVRGMTWFLFGRYGTPPLLAFISRQPMETQDARGVVMPQAAAPAAWWRAPLEDFKREIGWLHERGDQLLEYLALPVLHLIAAALNFGMVLLTGRPLFSLPFRGLKEALETREVLAGLQLQPRKQGNL